MLKRNALSTAATIALVAFIGSTTFSLGALQKAQPNLPESGDASELVVIPLILHGNDHEPPVAVDDAYSTAQDTQLNVSADSGVLANDQSVDPSLLRAVLVTTVTNGTLTLNEDGSLDYSPAIGFTGQDSFTYVAADNLAQSEPTPVTINVSPSDHEPPLAAADFYATQANASLNVSADIGVLANDLSPDESPLQAILVTSVSHGTLALNDDGSFEYYPEPGFVGEDSFTYVAADTLSQSEPALVTINVAPSDLPNQPPKIVSGVMAFRKQLLDEKARGTHDAVTADLDNDGDNDITATNYEDGEVYWYENDGSNNNFTKHVLDQNLNGAYPISVGDVDGDGDSDVMAGGYDGDLFVWYRNDGDGSLVRIKIDSSNGAHSIIAADLDQDGDNDLVTSSQDAGIIAWYENDGEENFALHVVDTTAVDAKRAEVADLDDDGDIDIMTASFGVNEIAWLENDGEENFTKHVITTEAIGAYFVATGDVDGDGDLDVFSASRKDGRFVWYRNDGEENFETIDIDKKAPGARTILASDIDGDGDIDAIGAAVNTDQIRIYLNDGQGKFKKQVIDPDANGAYGVFAIDFDFDGDIDISSASKIGNEVSLHTQIRAHLANVSAGGTLLIDTSLLRTVDVDDNPAGLTYTLVSIPGNGALMLGDAVLAVGDSFTQADIDNNLLRYVNDGSAVVRDGFSFSVADGGEDGVRPATGEFALRIGQN